MATESTHPVHAINRFLWDRISTDGILSKTDYTTAEFPQGIVPIVPVEETPVLMGIIDAQAGVGSLPYIVYTWSKVPGGQDWFIKEHEVAYALRSADNTKTRRLLNLFENLFEDYDQAAHRVNAYNMTNGSQPLKRFHFKEIHLSMLGSQMPAEREAGVNEALISIRVKYTEPKF
jgi:hypothetical protein